MAFCDVSFSWAAPPLPRSIVSFTFKELIDENCEETKNVREKESGDKVKEKSSDAVLADNDEFQIQSKTPISISRVEDHGDYNNCEMRITCKNAESNRINGLIVVSESKTIEISNDCEGYIKSVRGKKLHTANCGESNAEEQLFTCKCFLPDVYTNLTVKFLSLGKQTSFSLYSLVINIAQNVCSPLPAKGTFDMDKLMKNVTEMGDGVSDRAKDFLAILEQHKQNTKNQMNIFNQDMKPSNDSPFDLSKLVSSLSSHMGAGPNPMMAQMFTQLPGLIAGHTATSASLLNAPKSQKHDSASENQACSMPLTNGGASEDSSLNEVLHMKQEQHPNQDQTSKDIIEKLLSKVDQNTQALTRQMETFQQDVMMRLDAQRTEFHKRFEAVEEKLDLILRTLSASAESKHSSEVS